MLVEAQLRGSLDRAIARKASRLKLQTIRTMKRFAEDEIVIPSGRYEGHRFHCDRQPFTHHWFDLIDSHQWQQHFATGPVQASKTLCGSTIPVLYHLFEMGEPVVYAVPSGDMAADKWKMDILPVIQRTRYADLLPDHGSGSRGADKITLIRFKNDAVLRFMGAGGDDTTRAGFTTRVVVMTEADKFKDKSKQSKEANPFEQIRDRLQSWGEDSIFYGETTVSVREGIVWQHWIKGTGTQPYLRCPHCHNYVVPERHHLLGWQQASTIYVAKRDARIHCPSCGAPWTETERRTANDESIPLHRGQRVEDGAIVGDAPETDTLSFRWTCVHNQMSTMGVVAGKEWDAVFGAGAEDPDNSELTLRQKFWVVPPDPEVSLEPGEFKPFPLMRRMGERLRNTYHDKMIVPAWGEKLVCGIDCKESLLHFNVLAFGEGGRSQVIDNGVEEVHTSDFGPEQAIFKAIISLARKLIVGYNDERDNPMYITRSFIDANYMRDWVVAATLKILEMQKDNNRPPGLDFNTRVFWPIIGYGLSTDRRKTYTKPREHGPNVLKIGLGSYLGYLDEKKTQVGYLIDVDYWKSDVRKRLACSIDDPTAMTFWHTEDPKDHLSLAKHLCAETPHTEFIPGLGYKRTWLRKNRNNHLLDATTYARTASWWEGIRIAEPEPEEEETETTPSGSNGAAPPSSRLVLPEPPPAYLPIR